MPKAIESHTHHYAVINITLSLCKAKKSYIIATVKHSGKQRACIYESSGKTVCRNLVEFVGGVH